jgi:hypothetical protein
MTESYKLHARRRNGEKINLYCEETRELSVELFCLMRADFRF